MRQINKIIIHCSATPEGRKTSADEIKSWHLERGFSDIGYHYIVHLDGSISYGRNIDKIGAHSKGQNKMSIGVCYIGGLDECLDPKDTRTPQQKESLLILLKTLKKLHSKAVIYGHRDFSDKACPSFNAFDEYKFIE
jgi:N-acetylmuramoyl-L-alanine amidase